MKPFIGIIILYFACLSGVVWMVGHEPIADNLTRYFGIIFLTVYATGFGAVTTVMIVCKRIKAKKEK